MTWAVAMLAIFATFFIADAGHCYSIQGGCEACIKNDGGGQTCGWCEGRCQMASDPCGNPLPLGECGAPAPPPPAKKDHSETGTSTCGSIRKAFTNAKCCTRGDASLTDYSIVPMPHKSTVLAADNPCAGSKPVDAFAPGDGYFNDVNCTLAEGVLNALEQSATEVTKGYKGGLNTTGREPITIPYWQAGMCPVNVHWHLGTEHKSKGEYDENGTGPAHRRLAANARQGFQCHKYDSTDPKFTTEFEWHHCVGMHVGETYEVHWPHSAAGACGTPHQYQTPFYDGVFCRDGIITLDPLNTYMKIGVQAQVFTIVNDESYFYPDLIRGMLVDGNYGEDIAKYTGSTTGTSRNNEICSRYTPITWQVDRKCHLISASTFDKMCADMKAQRDDMSGDLYAHGARELVSDAYAADNHHRRLDDPERKAYAADNHNRRLDDPERKAYAADNHHRRLDDPERKADGLCPGDKLCATYNYGVHPDGEHEGDHDEPSPTPTKRPTPTRGSDELNPCWPSACDEEMESSTNAPIAEIAAAAPGEGQLLSYMGSIFAAWLI